MDIIGSVGVVVTVRTSRRRVVVAAVLLVGAGAWAGLPGDRTFYAEEDRMLLMGGRTPEAVERLATGMRQRDPARRAEALDVLWSALWAVRVHAPESGPTEPSDRELLAAAAAAVPALMELLDDPRAEVRRKAAECLPLVGPGAASAREGLQRASRDEDPDVRVEALVSLEALGFPEPAIEEARTFWTRVEEAQPMAWSMTSGDGVLSGEAAFDGVGGVAIEIRDGIGHAIACRGGWCAVTESERTRVTFPMPAGADRWLRAHAIRAGMCQLGSRFRELAGHALLPDSRRKTPEEGATFPDLPSPSGMTLEQGSAYRGLPATLAAYRLGAEVHRVWVDPETLVILGRRVWVPHRATFESYAPSSGAGLVAARVVPPPGTPIEAEVRMLVACLAAERCDGAAAGARLSELGAPAFAAITPELAGESSREWGAGKFLLEKYHPHGVEPYLAASAASGVARIRMEAFEACVGRRRPGPALLKRIVEGSGQRDPDVRSVAFRALESLDPTDPGVPEALRAGRSARRGRATREVAAVMAPLLAAVAAILVMLRRSGS